MNDPRPVASVALSVAALSASLLLSPTAPGATRAAPAGAATRPVARSAEGRAPYALLVVLDASGSMKQAVPGGVKRDLAQRGLLRMLATLPEGSLAALRLIGEGEPGTPECQATRAALPFAPFAAERWAAALGQVRWEGTTPLGVTLRRALEQLRTVNAARKEILLIGDGEEMCGEDPVAIARELADGVRVHTMSLGERISQQLAGIALVTNATYTRVYDETTFAQAGSSLPQAAAAVPAGAPAVDPTAGAAGALHVILDVSNSMWGQVDGRPKIELAREALRDALAELPEGVPVGLRAYGHRVSYLDERSSCTDTELLVPPQAGAAREIIARADRLIPRGQTPIARSLRAAADDLAGAGGGGVLLLVSDGLESCGGDPEAVIAELRAAGQPVLLHTIGLGVDATEAAALAALAQAGGGRYFDAGSAPAVAESMAEAVRTSREFVLATESPDIFPSPIVRVRGGDAVQQAELIVPGTYSFTDHLLHTQRYFAVAGEPGQQFLLAGLVCALGIGRKRDGTITYGGTPSSMIAQPVDAAGERIRGPNLHVRGDMGTWSELTLTVGEDGYARFRVGLPSGYVHRDMVFEIRPR